MSGMVDLFALLACLAVGGLLGYLIALVRRSPMGEETAQLRSQVAAGYWSTTASCSVAYFQ